MSRTVFSFSVSAALLGLLVTAASCASSQRTAPEAANNDGTVVSHTPPFQTKEPDRYRATRTITSVTPTGETITTQNRIARDGNLRRDERDYDGLRVVHLDLNEGSFVLLPDQRQFADVRDVNPESGNSNEDSESLTELLAHTNPQASTYQRLGTESIGGRNTQKYRVVVNTSPNANVSVSETMIWIDEALQMPIKSELKSSNGTHLVIELSEIALEVDQSLFQVPKDYQKITFTELQKRLKQD